VTSRPSASALRTYQKKRDFSRTPEPKGGTSGRVGRPRFVVQKHRATTLHYDFRLQVGSVMKSWSVPKGPSLDPKVKRLAIKTEDHPLEYQSFEGVIPEGEYGAGTVIVWDAGTYRNITERDARPVPLERGLRDGHIAVWLNGKKLRGGFALTRLRRAKQEQWLLVKMQDAEAAPGRDITRTEPRSVRSGRTLEEVAKMARRPSRGRRWSGA
jgi:DNA ligase D-like protein (predicted 3'-phosphoesterase)